MPAARDLPDFLRELSAHPEWRAELRRHVLTEELLAVPGRLERVEATLEQLTAAQLRTEERVEQLAAAQVRTEERLQRLEAALEQLTARVDQLTQRLDQLTQRLDQLTQRVDQLTQRVDDLTQRLDQLTQRVDQLTQRVDQLTQRVDDLTQRVDQLTQRVDQLTQRVDDVTQRLEQLTARVDQLTIRLEELTARVQEGFERLAGRVGDLAGRVLEVRYHQHGPAYLARIARRLRVLPAQELVAQLEDGVDAGRLSEEDFDEVRRADLVLAGRRRDDQADVFLLVEVSGLIEPGDVERARGRADRLARLGRPTIAVVAGHQVSADVAELARQRGVWWSLDGQAHSPLADTTAP